MKLLIFSLFALLTVLPPKVVGAQATSARTLVVVVNKQNPISNVSSSVLARIYKGRQQKWSNGKQIVVVDRPVRSSERKAFYNQVLRTDPTKKFFEPGVPVPFRAIQIRSDEALMAFIRRVKDAVSYAYLDAVDERVKIVSIDGKKFTDLDYALKIEAEDLGVNKN